MARRLWIKVDKKKQDPAADVYFAERYKWPLRGDDVFKAPCFWGWDGVLKAAVALNKTSGFLILPLKMLVVIGYGLQVGDMTNAFGHSLPEEHLSPHLQILWVLDELEENHCFLPCPQLLL